MLVLARKSRQAVVVGGVTNAERVLTVTVLEIRGGCVKLGFEADATIPVHRAEVWERMRADGNTIRPNPLAAPNNRHPRAATEG